jgi:hypothetical protein
MVQIGFALSLDLLLGQFPGRWWRRYWEIFQYSLLAIRRVGEVIRSSVEVADDILEELQPVYLSKVSFTP